LEAQNFVVVPAPLAGELRTHRYAGLLRFDGMAGALERRRRRREHDDQRIGSSRRIARVAGHRRRSDGERCFDRPWPILVPAPQPHRHGNEDDSAGAAEDGATGIRPIRRPHGAFWARIVREEGHNVALKKRIADGG